MNPVPSIARTASRSQTSRPNGGERPQFHSLAGTRRHLPSFPLSYLLIPLLLTLSLPTTHSIGQEDRELWVPTEHLDAVLKKMPRAVLLAPQHYDRLRADFKKAHLDRSKAESQPPVPATIRSASITGTVEPGASVVALTATYEVKCFTDGWTEVPLLLPAAYLGHVSIDEQSAIRSGPKQPTTLLTHGRGIHTVAAIYHLPVKRSPGGNAITLTAPGVPAKVTLTFPTDAEVESALPFFREPESDRAVFALPSQSGSTHDIRWSAQKVAPIPGAAVLQTCSYVYNLEATNIRADLGFVISSNLTDLPRRFTIQYPEDFRVLSVDGSELLRWSHTAPGQLETVLLPGDRDATDLRILLERDLVASSETDAEDITVELPVATIPGVHRASGTFSLIGSGDVRVKTIETGSLAAPIPDNAEGALANVPHYVASFSFPVSSDPPRVTLSPVQNRFNAQIDTLVTLQREQIAIERTLQILPREGTVFHVDLTLPADEEFTEAVSGRDDFSWKRLDATTLRLLWEKGTAASGTAGVTLSTRRDPEGWYSLGQDPAALDFAASDIVGADAVSGYLAVAFDPSFQVKTVDSEGLEIRDARTTPVTGALAWFRLEDFGLSLEASRRPPELEAAVTAYVLPLATTLEIEGQLDLAIRYSGIDELDVSLPPDVAPLFRFDSPFIAEQTLLPDDAGWNLRFHQERKEFTQLKFRAVLPVGDEGERSETFTATLPRLGVPAARRLRGHWIVEANTDTELNFEATGLDKIDSLRVPVVEGYQPRHRIIAAYRYRGDEGSLTLSGTRHEHAEAVTTVVDSLRIDTVASTDGTDRHQARLAVRSSGEQFLELTLPDDAILWTLLVDGETVKPVRSGKRSLRVQLPADKEGGAAVAIEIIYQTPGKKWGGSGSETLAPIKLADRIPVIQTEWFLHLPEGYDYQKFESNLGQEFEVVDRLLLGAAGGKFGPYLALPYYALATSEHSAGGHYESKSASEADLEIPAENSMAAINRIEGKLKTIIIPYVEFTDTPLRHALDFLQSRSVELDAYESDPAKKGINIALDSELTASPIADTPITLRLNNVPLGQVLRYTTRLAQLKYRTEPGTVAVVPLSAPDTHYTEVYTVPPDFLSSFRSSSADPFAPPVEADPPNPFGEPVEAGAARATAPPSAKEVLEAAGITFGPGSSADYNPRTGQLTVKNTRDQLELAEAFTDSLSATPGRRDELLIPTDNTTTEIRHIEERLKNIILPNVEFADTPLRDALEYLQQKSVELDINEANPAKKGVSLILDEGSFGASAAAAAPASDGFGFEAGGGTKTGEGSIGDTRITLRLSNVPLSEALRYTTSLAQLKYKVEPHAIVVVPLSTPDADLFTNVYTVPPTFLSDLGQVGNGGAAAADPFAAPVDTSGTVLRGRRTAKEILESAGITFGTGSSAIYNPTTGQLIVRNTQDQMELVEAYQDSITTAPSVNELLELQRKFPDKDFSKEIEEARRLAYAGNVAVGATLSAQSDVLFGGVTLSVDDMNDPVLAEPGAVEDKIPMLGDLPAVGRLFEKNAELGNARTQALSTLILENLDFENQTLEEAARTLNERLAEADPGMFPGAAVEITSVDTDSETEPLGEKKLGFKLGKATTLEVLDRITGATDTQYRVTASGILIAHKDVPLEPMETIFLPLPETEFQRVSETGETHGLNVRNVLTEFGIQFSPGASAIYNRGTGRLAVRNTQANLEAVVAHYSTLLATNAQGTGDAFPADRDYETRKAVDFLGDADQLRGFDYDDVGKRPLAFALPESGRSYRFAALYSPEPISFRFVNWERQIRFAWVWMLVGGLAFWFVAKEKLGRPVFIGFVGVGVLSFVPLLISKGLTEFCNALLLGWVVAMALALVVKLSRKVVGDEA